MKVDAIRGVGKMRRCRKRECKGILGGNHLTKWGCLRDGRRDLQGLGRRVHVPPEVDIGRKTNAINASQDAGSVRV